MLSSMLAKRLKGIDGLISTGRLALLPGATGSSDNHGLVSSVSGGACSGNLICRNLSLSSPAAMPFEKRIGPKHWPRYNLKVFPPQSLEEKRRPAYVCHLKENIKYPPWKMWYVTCLVRGMTVDEAIRQLDYVNKKGAHYVKQTLLEAQELAVQEQNVEFRSNLWVAESFCTKGVVVKGIRRHAKKRIGLVEYFHCHYFVRLEEGSPPKHYYEPEPDGPTLLQRWINERRAERVYGSI